MTEIKPYNGQFALYVVLRCLFSGREASPAKQHLSPEEALLALAGQQAAWLHESRLPLWLVKGYEQRLWRDAAVAAAIAARQAAKGGRPDDKIRRHLVYLKYWTLNLTTLMVYPEGLFAPNFIILRRACQPSIRLHLTLKSPGSMEISHNFGDDQRLATLISRRLFPAHGAATAVAKACA